MSEDSGEERMGGSCQAASGEEAGVGGEPRRREGGWNQGRRHHRGEDSLGRAFLCARLLGTRKLSQVPGVGTVGGEKKDQGGFHIHKRQGCYFKLPAPSSTGT